MKPEHRYRLSTVPVTFLPEAKEWHVPPHGEIKIKFKNEANGKITFTALLFSLRFHIKEANHGEFPKPQFVTDLEAGQEASFTIVDNPNQKISEEDLAVFLHKRKWSGDYELEEGKMVFTAGTLVETRSFEAFGQRTFGEEVRNKDGKLMTSYVEAGRPVGPDDEDEFYDPSLIPDTWPIVAKMVKLKGETPSYREMEAKRKTLDKFEEKMFRYRRRNDCMPGESKEWSLWAESREQELEEERKRKQAEKPAKKGCCSIS